MKEKIKFMKREKLFDEKAGPVKKNLKPNKKIKNHQGLVVKAMTTVFVLSALNFGQKANQKKSEYNVGSGRSGQMRVPPKVICFMYVTIVYLNKMSTTLTFM